MLICREINSKQVILGKRKENFKLNIYGKDVILTSYGKFISNNLKTHQSVKRSKKNQHNFWCHFHAIAKVIMNLNILQVLWSLVFEKPMKELHFLSYC